MAFSKKKIDIVISLASGTYGDGDANQITVSGLRASAEIVGITGDLQQQLQCQIWGLSMDTINELTTMGPIMTQMRNNRIVVTAGEENGAMATVYEGVISGFAYADFNAAPEVPFNIYALAAAYDSVKPGENKSYPEAVKAADVMARLAAEMGKAFENNGVDVTLPAGRYYSGSPLTQVKECARDANIYWTIERGTLAIWPKRSGYRKGDPINIDFGKGMVGYPCLSSNGLIVTTEFNPDISLGGRVNISSSLDVANGMWGVVRVVHMIESEMPGGSWFSQALCYRPEWMS